ncbi:MAG: hypothetical protein ACRDNJ_11140 [Solirubrobacteraceae bacterium]
MTPEQTRSPTYKTVVLSHGKHSEPGDGACVMELASMIAGEPFSDRPRAVCPVIAALLRAYNDAVDDRRRQDLYACAAQAVGTRSSVEVERLRLARIREWTLQMRHARRLRLPSLRRARWNQADPPAEIAAGHAVRSFGRHTARTHASMLALVDELCAIEAPDVTNAPAAPERASISTLTLS